MAPQRFADLTARQRRRQVLHATTSVTAAWLVVLGLYATLPFGRGPAWTVAGILLAGGLAFRLLLVRQVRGIVAADVPEVRAVEGIGLLVPFYLVLFAAAYLSLSTVSPGSFSRPLDHVAAAYFTVTVLSTVGFGDITPEQDLSRVLVTVQMLFNLVVLGLVVRVLSGTARSTLSAPG